MLAQVFFCEFDNFCQSSYYKKHVESYMKKIYLLDVFQLTYKTPRICGQARLFATVIFNPIMDGVHKIVNQTHVKNLAVFAAKF